MLFLFYLSFDEASAFDGNATHYYCCSLSVCPVECIAAWKPNPRTTPTASLFLLLCCFRAEERASLARAAASDAFSSTLA